MRYLSSQKIQHMKKIAFFLTMLLTVSVIGVNAQNNKPGPPKPPKSAEERTDMWMKVIGEKLAITQAQAPKTRDIVLKREKQRIADREKTKGDMEARKVAAKLRNETFDAEIKKVLTAEQFQNLQKIRKEHRTKMKEKRKQHENGKGQNPPAPPAPDEDDDIE